LSFSSPRFYLGLLVKSQLRKLGYECDPQDYAQKTPNDKVILMDRFHTKSIPETDRAVNLLFQSLPHALNPL